MAPEIANMTSSRTKYNRKADIFSLSVIAQELFDIDIYSSVLFNFNEIILKFIFILSSDEMIANNEKLRIKLNEIIDWILKMCHQIYKRRPTCSKLLSEYNQWSITGDDIKESFNYTEQLNQVQNSDNTFFNNYLTTKLNLQNDI